MARRYARAPVLAFGNQYGTSYAIPVIRENVKAGNIRVDEIILAESDRLDIIAGRIYGDGKLWWLIAAASDIGNSLQAPPGTIIKIPVLADALLFVS